MCRQRVDELYSTSALAERIDAWLDGVVSAIERPHDDHSVTG
jgi:hypothetical protein